MAEPQHDMVLQSVGSSGARPRSWRSRWQGEVLCVAKRGKPGVQRGPRPWQRRSLCFIVVDL
eukprot:1736260-Lingulodinium_polyedra.AAC.1